MTATQKAELRQAIGDAIVSTSRELAELEPGLAPIAPDCCLGELTRMELMGEQEVCAKAHDAASRRLNRLRFALTRIDRESFGICEACDEPIAVARLRIMPEATLCVACANTQAR